MRIGIPAAIALCALSASGARADYFRSGFWEGRTAEADGEFLSCTMSRSDSPGERVIIGYPRSRDFSLGAVHRGWRLKQGESYKVDLLLDGKPARTVEGIAAGIDHVLIQFDFRSPLVKDIRNAQSLDVSIDGKTATYAMGTVLQATRRLFACAQDGLRASRMPVWPQSLLDASEPDAAGPRLVPPDYDAAKPRSDPFFDLDALVAKSANLKVQLDVVRAAVEKYRDWKVAVRDFYLSTMGCVHYAGENIPGHAQYEKGGVGVRFINPLINGAPDAKRPNVLIYEPVGKDLKLVAVAWMVPRLPGMYETPKLFGMPFIGPFEGIEPLVPDDYVHYDMGFWLKPNKLGLFAATNPDVKCEGYDFSLLAKPPRLLPGP